MVQLSRTDKCIDEIFEAYSGMVYRICLAALKDKSDAEDAFQEVFLRLYSVKKDFESEEHLKAWLIRVSCNLCKNMRRGRGKMCICLSDGVGAEAPDNERSPLAEAVLGLPKKYSTVIYLHYFEGYKTDEIAKILKTNGSTVRSQLKRGREILKETLEADKNEIA